ncbi:MAG: deoxyribonuclease [Frankiaceae bacterium]|nr:deoxyribonuclease [Frankiaceae bacterium]
MAASRRRSPIGAHVFVGAGLAKQALPYAESIGAEALQVFVSNPRGWATSAGDAAADTAFASSCRERSMPVYVHAPYLVNFGSPTELTRERSAAAVAHSLRRGALVGAAGVVVHAGSAVDAAHRDRALGLMRERLLPVLDALGDDDPDVLVEPTAGGGQPLAAVVDDLEPLFEALSWHPRLGVCLDTCHAFAAGHDVSTPAGMRRTLDAVVRAVGADRLRLVHANDSKDPCGSGRDRHAAVGSGLISLDAFGALLRHPAVRSVPVLIETAPDDVPHAEQLASLRARRP